MTITTKDLIMNTIDNKQQGAMFIQGEGKLSALMPFALDAIQEGVFILDCTTPNHSILHSNAAMRKITGVPNNLCQKTLGEVFEPENATWLITQTQKVKKFQETVEKEVLWSLGKSQLNLKITLMPIVEDGQVSHIIGTMQKVQQNEQQAEPLRQKHERYVTALEYAPYGVCFIGDDGKPSMVNRSLCQWLDMPLNFILKSHISNFFSEIDKAVFNQALQKVINSGRSYRGIELKLKTVTGQHMWVSLSMSRVANVENPYTIVQFVDVTKRKLEESELLKLATQDHLTKLSNRKVFDESLAMSIKQAKRYNREGAVVYIDLDNFKGINDNYGHKAGDAILQEVGKVLRDVFRETDTVSRIGGDEFAVIMNEVACDEAQSKADIVEQKIREIRITAHDKQVSVSASMGVQIFGGTNCQSEEAIIEAADKAMYSNKAASKNEGTAIN